MNIMRLQLGVIPDYYRVSDSRQSPFASIECEYDAATGLVKLGGHRVTLDSLDHAVQAMLTFRHAWRERRKEATRGRPG